MNLVSKTKLYNFKSIINFVPLYNLEEIIFVLHHLDELNVYKYLLKYKLK